MKYRKKPVEIEALQWTGKNHREMYDFLTQNAFDKEYMKVSGENFYIDHSKVEGGLIIKTLEREHIATIGDYIIRGVKGEYYPCKEDIFNQTYEKVEGVSITIRDTDWPIDWWKQPSDTDDKVPYSSICGCNPKNGGSGICNCVIGNKLVDKPKRFGEVRTTNFPIM